MYCRFFSAPGRRQRHALASLQPRKRFNFAVSLPLCPCTFAPSPAPRPAARRAQRRDPNRGLRRVFCLFVFSRILGLASRFFLRLRHRSMQQRVLEQSLLNEGPITSRRTSTLLNNLLFHICLCSPGLSILCFFYFQIWLTRLTLSQLKYMFCL